VSKKEGLSEGREDDVSTVVYGLCVSVCEEGKLGKQSRSYEQENV
jgi:hypothetical protein